MSRRFRLDWIKDKEGRKARLPLILGTIPLMLAGFDAISQGSHLFGFLHLLLAAANMTALRFVGRTPVITNVILFMLNACMALAISYDYFQQGKKGLPYAWIVIALIYFAATFFVAQKEKSKARV